MLDQCDLGDGGPELHARLKKRQAERDALHMKVERWRQDAAIDKPAPTLEWIEAELGNLRDDLAEGGPAAAAALRQLIAPVLVTLIKRPHKQRHYLRGQFGIRLSSLVSAIDGNSSSGSASQEPAVKMVVIDFRRLGRYEELADDMKADFEAGMAVKDILEKYECSYTVWTKAWSFWHQSRGLAVPDGRSLRGRLPRNRTADKLQGDVMRLWHNDLPVLEIAQQLGCSLEKAREVVVTWHEERGLTVPDGRARRKAIRLRREQPPEGEAA